MARKFTPPAARGEGDPSASQASLPDTLERADPSHGKKPPDPAAPRAGRTGGLGSRAERPSPGSKQPVETTHQDQCGRRGKAPSTDSESRRATPARNR